ncbi:MAG: hypothetical protein J2P23_12665 [Microlunatus sp.]|nr:hypothetical protein [Microlunatus sp.]
MSRVDSAAPPSHGRPVVGRLVPAAVGAVVAGLAVGTLPGFAAPPALGAVGGILTFAGLLLAALRALPTVGRDVWRWAAGFGVALASSAVIGVLVRTQPVRGPAPPVNAALVSWLAVRWLGLGWLATCLFAVAAHAVDRAGMPKRRGRRAQTRQPVGAVRSFLAALPRSLTSPSRAARRRSLLAVLSLLVLARLPYLVIWWPGIFFFDSHRGYDELLGIRAWTAYEPVGHTLMIGLARWLGTTLGLGATGEVAIESFAQIAAMSAAFALLLVRLAVWGVPRTLWFAALGWVVLMPLVSLFSVVIIKDEPFAAALVFFMVALGELVFGADPRRLRWPWAVLVVSAVFLIGTRNNGSYFVLLSLPVLIIVLRGFRRQLLVVLVAAVVVYAAYVGPLYRALGVGSGPKAMAYSVPVQQLARIATVHGGELSDADRKYLLMVFEQPPEVFSPHYVPELSDPMVLRVRDAWRTHSTMQMLSGWPRLVAEYPGTAAVATLANTVGYWDPTSSSYKNLVPLLTGIELPIRTLGLPKTGLRGWLVNGGIMPAMSYRTGESDSGFLTVPVLGSAMSPGFVSWLWIGALVLVVRRRAWSALIMFVPPAVLMLTVIAAGTSGGQRYELPFFMTLPLAAAIPFLVARAPGRPRPALPRPLSRPTATPTPAPDADLVRPGTADRSAR